MSIEKQIVEWIATRPIWQRLLLQQIAAGQFPDKRQIDSLIDRMLRDDWSAHVSFEEEDIPSAQVDQKQVSILKIANLEHVNALMEGQELPLEQKGLTVVYGDNASGKSGYARLLKSVVRSRTKDDVLSNVFADSTDTTPAAQVVALHGNDAIEIDWPSQDNHNLKKVLFYDEACGDAYVTREGDIGYRPYAMMLFDGLIQACDQLRAELNLRIGESERNTQKLPSFSEQTSSFLFLSQLSADTTDEELDEACSIPSDFEQRLKGYISEEARLRSTDPNREKAKLQRKRKKLETVLSHFQKLFEVLGKGNISKLEKFQKELLDRSCLLYTSPSPRD